MGFRDCGVLARREAGVIVGGPGDGRNTRPLVREAEQELGLVLTGGVDVAGVWAVVTPVDETDFWRDVEPANFGFDAEAGGDSGVG